jgi:DNA-binding NarL/FixJ family response regulator
MPDNGIPAPIRVVIADDDQLYLSSLRELIDRQPEMSVVGAARDGVEAIDLVEQLSPEAAVIDLHMPRLDGVQALEQLRREHPSLCLIALTGDPEPELGRAATRAGADGVFLKGELVEKLLDRLAAVAPPAQRHPSTETVVE